MQSKMHLTDLAIKKMKCPIDAPYYEIADTKVPGLAIRVGKRTKVFRRRAWVGGKKTAVTIGEYPGVTLEEAREEAAEIKKQIRRGENPNEEKRKSRAAKERDTNESYEKLIDKYLADYSDGVRESTFKETRRLLKGSIPQGGTLKKSRCFAELADRPVRNITTADLQEVLRKIRKTTPVESNRLHSALSGFFKWLIEEGVITASPMAAITKKGKEAPRDRFLDEKEIKVFWVATEMLPYPYQQWYRLCLVLGQRSGEISSMCWSDIESGVWTIPAIIAKNGKRHEVPLTPLALSVIESCPRFTGCDYVLTADGENRPWKNSKQTTKLQEACGFKSPWTIHDLRHTIATGMIKSLQRPAYEVGLVLNHSKPSTGATRVYDNHDYMPEKRRALSAWSEYLSALCEIATPEKVLAFPA